MIPTQKPITMGDIEMPAINGKFHIAKIHFVHNIFHHIILYPVIMIPQQEVKSNTAFFQFQNFGVKICECFGNQIRIFKIKIKKITNEKQRTSSTLNLVHETEQSFPTMLFISRMVQHKVDIGNKIEGRFHNYENLLEPLCLGKP